MLLNSFELGSFNKVVNGEQEGISVGFGEVTLLAESFSLFAKVSFAIQSGKLRLPVTPG